MKKWFNTDILANKSDLFALAMVIALITFSFIFVGSLMSVSITPLTLIPILIFSAICSFVAFIVFNFSVNTFSEFSEFNKEAKKLSKVKALKDIELEKCLANAEQHIIDIVGFANEIKSSKLLSAKINNIANTARKIVDQVYEDPADFKKARNWFYTILPETASLIDDMHRQDKWISKNSQLAITNNSNMIDTLEKIDIGFNEILHSTNDEDMLSLNVNMDVLLQYMNQKKG